MYVAAGDTSQLVIELPLGQRGGRPVETQVTSPIPQLDGAYAAQKMMFSFKSEFGEEDIEYSLSELLPENVAYTFLSRVRLGPRSADHLCTLELQPVDGLDFSWPFMNSSDSEVLREVQRI